MKCDVTYDGTAYPFDFDTINLPEAFTIKTVAHLNLGQFQVQAMDFNPHALLALAVLALRRAGQAVIATDIDQTKFDVNALADSFQAAIAAARKAAPAGDGDTSGSGDSAE